MLQGVQRVEVTLYRPGGRPNQGFILYKVQAIKVVTGRTGRAHHGPAGHQPAGHVSEHSGHLLFPGEAVRRTAELIGDIRLSLGKSTITTPS